jgi:hypothetical protein
VNADRPGLGDLPAFVTRQDLAALGFGRGVTDAVFGTLPVVSVPGVRRAYVRREDLAAFLADHTYPNDRVRPL